MSCHRCGQRGHKFAQCPRRLQGVKCYQCGEMGHYKNDCQLLIKREEEAKKAAELEKIQMNMPDLNKKLANREQLLSLLNGADSLPILRFKSTDWGSVKMRVRENVVIIPPGKSSALEKVLPDTLPVEEFLDFIERKGLDGSVVYQKFFHGAESLVHFLHDAGIVEMRSEKKAFRYFLNNRQIMRMVDERGWETHLSDGCEELIYQTFDQFKNDGTSVKNEIGEKELRVLFVL